ncbi:hypothetical protein SODALDRAFT_380027 [Sodiomyces alkalinus F11]|uniref:Uncharacterized protein n=1 Tax=Sodiomyces alkalinus (strain CBS 110278 / VKM F-3762 / F11) TaxID=1314773 RepID=A0A3N2PSU1_SODAK|nr:hypothetical protein SODALDRAFT_380027 [Sodiomyces alkalinus F11]ROT37577.1 hypothetical protein SODALDRAFT_380027 [Sodiomyces alkalinus F11]
MVDTTSCQIPGPGFQTWPGYKRRIRNTKWCMHRPLRAWLITWNGASPSKQSNKNAAINTYCTELANRLYLGRRVKEGKATKDDETTTIPLSLSRARSDTVSVGLSVICQVRYVDGFSFRKLGLIRSTEYSARLQLSINQQTMDMFDSGCGAVDSTVLSYSVDYDDILLMSIHANSSPIEWESREKQRTRQVAEREMTEVIETNPSPLTQDGAGSPNLIGLPDSFEAKQRDASPHQLRPEAPEAPAACNKSSGKRWENSSTFIAHSSPNSPPPRSIPAWSRVNDRP